MTKVIMYKGLPGCGKSTDARALMAKQPNSYKRVNKDDIRAMVDDNYWSRDAEKLVLTIQDAIILASLNAGKNVLVDNTNLAPKHEGRIRSLAKSSGAEFEIKDFTRVPIEECIKNDLKRNRSVGEKVIRDMYNQFLRPSIPTIEYNKELDDCIICDLDGTLAFLNGRNPYDASTCENDGCNTHLTQILSAMLATSGEERDLDIILFSGREDKYRSQTERFLAKHRIHYDALYMRETGDGTRDSIVKEYLYKDHVKGKYNVVAVFDDRLQVCRMWHELGLPLFRVGDPEANF